MILAKFDSRQFMKEMNNLVEYSIGFVDGVKLGKVSLFNKMGEELKDFLANFIDANARIEPSALHHVYEWQKSGSPEARLFDIEYTISNAGLSMASTFRQSTSVKAGSETPFYDKARVMEAGVSVTVRPRKSDVLVFDADGETVFTKNPVRINNPGGAAVAGSFQRTFDMFFEKYFTQSFLRASGLMNHLSNPSVYKKDLPAGVRFGKSKGLASGFKWIANAKVGK
jgi:hypothetical protein